MAAIGARVRALGALAGFLAVLAALAAAQLTTILSAAFDSPVTYVANAVIERSPAPVTRFAIEVFGQDDKLALIVGELVLLILFGVGVGLLALRRLALAVAAVAVLGMVGFLAGVSTGEGVWSALVPTVAAVIGGAAALMLLVRKLSGAGVAAEENQGDAPASRRRFLRAAGGVVVFSAAAGALGTAFRQAVEVGAQRARVLLPTPVARTALPIPDAAHPDVPRLDPFITPNPEFYRIDTALVVPRIDPSSHVIRVIGMVDQELEIPFSQLLQRDMIEVPMNLVCVSNEIGGELVDAAVWQGVLLRDLLEDAGVADDATEIVGRSVDGYTCGFPVEKAFDRPALVAVGMNGEPLPAEHGFPVRLVTPGIYGYVGSTKWLGEIQLTRFDQFDQYWATRGYADHAPVKISSRIDVPQAMATVTAGTVPVAGSAWAPIEGIQQVQVRIDGGNWREAELAAEVNDLTWRQWVYRWEASAGEHRISVRAMDANGEVQIEERSGVRPDGATGYHTIPVTVVEA